MVSSSSKRCMLLASVIACVPVALLAACHGSGAAPSGKTVVLDGSLDDWPEGVQAQWHDDRYLYLRLEPPAKVTLQSHDEPLVLYVDIDGNGATGISPPAVPGEEGEAALGADLLVVFSPCTAFPSLTEKANGIAVAAVFEDGSSRVVSHADVDFAFSPTYASDQYEMRLSRTGMEQVTGRAFSAEGVASRFVLLSASGALAGASDVARGSRALEAASATETLAGVPFRGAGEVRVVSWNVERGAPNTKPDAFARVLGALDPDIVLVQEWTDVTPETLAAWFNEHVASGSPWHAITSAGWGVAIVSRYPLERLGPERLDHPPAAPADAWNRDRDAATRFVGAVVQTPAGPVGAGSVHLKCCGSQGSPEDLARIAEAEQIRAAFASAADERALALRVIGGDMNLVGSRTPLETLTASGDADGTGLLPADPRVLADTTFATWSQADSQFSPGRLDWIVVGDSALTVRRAFVLDTERLTPEALRAMGLHERDSRASDHMPVVVDVAPVR